jgi:hypothetical protein
MDGMEVFREAVDQAYVRYRKALGKLVVKTLKELAAKDPEATYEYSAGMGVWGFTRNGPTTVNDETFTMERDIEPDPAYEAILDADSDYGNSVVPDGTFTIKGKKIIESSIEL